MINKQNLTKLFCGALLTALLLGCTPKTIEETSSDITAVSEVANGGTKVLQIEMKPSSGYDQSSFFFMATQEINTVLGKIVEYFPDQQPDQIKFVLSTGLIDKYGTETEHAVIGLVFDMVDIKKINFAGGGVTNWDLLGLVKELVFPHPAGKAIIRAYCQDASNDKYAAGFCRRNAI